MRDANPSLRAGPASHQWALPKRVWPWVAGMALILLLGGGNWTMPLPRLLAQLVGVAMLVAALAVPAAIRPAGIRTDGAASRLNTVDRLVLAMLALFALHMVPLPPWLWTALPGRELAALADRQVFGAPLWRPLSIDPSATLDSLLMLLPALAVYCAVRRGDEERRRALLAGTLLALLAAIITGLLQLALPDGALQFYPRGDYANPVGFFTNRNHQATFLLMALPLAALLLDGGRESRAAPALFALGLGVAIAALVTGSRSGAALLPVALVATALGWLGTQPGQANGGPGVRRLWLAVAMLVVIVLGLGLLAASGADSLSAVLRRGEVAEDQRFDFWPLVAGAGAAFWPMGSGIGTFLEGYEMHEPLSSLSPLYVNHAHNDYLEIFLEAGIPGLILALVVIAELASLAWWAWRRGGPVRARPARLAAVALLLPVLHSLVDYPLRTISITCLFALAAALLATVRDSEVILQRNQPG